MKLKRNRLIYKVLKTVNFFLGAQGVPPMLVWRYMEGIRRATHSSGLFGDHTIT